MFRIGEFSKLCQLPTSVLRYYDDIGIFKPKHTDPYTGYRYYTLDQLPRLNRILALKDLDLSLAEIDQIVNEDITPEALRGMLRLKQAELSQQVAEAQARLRRVTMRLNYMESEDKMPDYDVIVKPTEGIKVASIREKVPTVDLMPQRCGAMFDAIVAWLKANQQRPSGPALAMYYNPEYVETDIDVENGIVVGPSVAMGSYPYGDFTITVREIPPVDHIASTIHKGDFADLITAWQALAQWVDVNGYDIVGPPSREFYLSPPNEPPVVEIQYQVKLKE